MENVLDIIKENINENQYQEFLTEFNNYLIENGFYYDDVNSFEDKLEKDKEDYNKIEFINKSNYQMKALNFLKIYVEKKYIEPYYMRKFILNHERIKSNLNHIPVQVDDIEETGISDARETVNDIYESNEVYEERYINKMEKSLDNLKREYHI